MARHKSALSRPAAGTAGHFRIHPYCEGSRWHQLLRFDYDWRHEGEAQTGLLVFACDEENCATAAWIDSFHMSSRIMFCIGTTNDGVTNLRGSYAAPPGPDWGWRINLRSLSPAQLQLTMHNISPEGQEDLAVQADYTRHE